MLNNITGYMEEYDHENLVVCQHKDTGLKAFIAIHDTTLGPAVGGCRMWPYEKEEEAVEDALRLGRGMTYKYAAAGVNLGGGKAVIMGDPAKDKSEALFRALGRFIDRLGGAYYTGLDAGTVLQDMEYIRQETEYVVTLPVYLGGAGPISPYTARSTILGMKASLQELTGDSSLRGKRIAVQGAGDVGYNVIKYLVEEEALEITVTDIDEQRVRKVVDDFGAKTKIMTVEPGKIYDTPCDIFSPCALGAVINRDTVGRLKCKAVSGSANNQLKEDSDGDLLNERGILYAPDFIVNSGGTIYDTDRIMYGSHDHERAKKNVEAVYDKICRIFEIARQEKVIPYRAAEILARRRIEAYSNIKIL